MKLLIVLLALCSFHCQGACPNIKNNEGKTPLMYAVQLANNADLINHSGLSIVRSLLAIETIELDIKDKDGKTAADYIDHSKEGGKIVAKLFQEVQERQKKQKHEDKPAEPGIKIIDNYFVPETNKK